VRSLSPHPCARNRSAQRRGRRTTAELDAGEPLAAAEGTPPMTWIQNYDPLGWWPLSTLVSALPVLTLFVVLLVLRKRVWVSALAGMVMAIALALLVFRMPAGMIVAASLNGFVFGFFRIAWIVIASIYLYNVAVETGQFQVMRESIAGLSSDRRLQVILIAFCFGAFLEGTGGGGAPVAIAGSFLIGLGFPPFQAATLCLLANTAPVAWGGVGNPIRVLNGVTGLPMHELNAMVGRILPPFSFILPAWLVVTMVGWRKALEVLPALLVSGASFAGMQFYWSNYQETGLVDIVAAMFSLLVMVGFLRVWKPKGLVEDGEARTIEPRRRGVLAVLKGWSPFALASVFIFLWAQSTVVAYLKVPALTFPTPGLHNLVIRTAPVVPVPTPETASVDFNFFALPGTAVFLGAFLVAPFLGVSVSRSLRILGRTFRQLVPSMLAISFMVGLAYVTKYAGMDTVLGLSLTRTGWIYPLFGTLLGWMGVALTGTDAGSNALFGNLQKVTAEQLGLSPVLMSSANSAGGVMGKMIDAQSIVVASTSTGLEGREGDIWKAVFWHSLVLALLVGLTVMLYAYVTPWVIP
jgi:lactate permease